jgi:hypothetical protein
MNRGNQARRGGGNPPRRKPNASRAFSKGLENGGDQIVKRITLSGDVLATGAGTAIGITSVGSSTTTSGTGPTGGAEWASFASRYQQYRVRAIRITGKATQPVQTATISHSDLYRGDYIGTQAPGSAAQVFSDEMVKSNATYRDFTHVVTWKKNPNARLWNPTSAAIPAANTYSWVCASPPAPALTTATTYYAFTVEWEVEFRGSQ